MNLIVSFEFVTNENGNTRTWYRGMESGIHVARMNANDIEREVRGQLGIDIGSMLTDYECQFVILNIIKVED
jgi:hypothetical protein